MSTVKRSKDAMFNEFKLISSAVMTLSGIIQNEETIIDIEELTDWVDTLNLQIERLNSLKEEVIRFYND